MTYSKLLELLQSLSPSQKDMEVIVVVPPNAEAYLFPTMMSEVVEDSQEEGFKAEQPILS